MNMCGFFRRDGISVTCRTGMIDKLGVESRSHDSNFRLPSTSGECAAEENIRVSERSDTERGERETDAEQAQQERDKHNLTKTKPNQNKHNKIKSKPNQKQPL